jgi:ABC-type uncharacterized transport system ATPase component
MHKTFKYLKSIETKILNIFGKTGVGKSRFCEEIAFYMHIRYHYLDGIYIIDIDQKSNIKKIKPLISKILNDPDQDFYTYLENKNALLIFENVDIFEQKDK